MPKTDQEKTDAFTKLLFATPEERPNLRESKFAASQMTRRLSLISRLSL